ncbi:MAG: alanine--tRNA ligase-related protein, partial [Nanoarchaeota archaeon]|nr:alanine--tRNA ligase-related protein [Nanoarchaeota archaeon]
YSDDLVRKIYKYLGKIDFESTDKKEAIKYASERIGIKEDELNKIVDNLSAIYKIADYTRTLLVAIHDGALPSNVGGGYNLREILRIAQNLIDIHGWKFSLNDVIEVHKREFGAWFTELNDFDISNVINKEVERYHEFKARNLEKIREIIEKGSIDEKEMKLLYESYGIAPEDILMEAEAENKKVVVPDVRLEIIKENKSVKKIDTGNIPPTKQMFYNKELTKTNAKIIKKIDDKTIVLDRTIFYPEMGGQKSDRGKIDGIDVIDVQKADDVILHHLASPINKKEGEKVLLIVDNERRSILRRQHTATHIINQAARRILGGFVNQYGAEKDIEKSHLDITYFDKIPEDIVRKIEQEANEI